MWSRKSQLAALLYGGIVLLAHPCVAKETPEVRVLSIAGTLSAGGDGANTRTLQPGDVLSAGTIVTTGASSRAAIDFGGLSVLRLGADARVIVPDLFSPPPLRLQLLAGEIYLFNRRPAASVVLATPDGDATLLGTELHVLIESDRATIFTLFDGSLRFGSVEGPLLQSRGEEGFLENGEVIERGQSVDIGRRIQWALYYPAVLEPADLPRGITDEPRLQEALTAYRAGNPVAALQALPDERNETPVAAALKAALLLAAGRVDQAELLLAGPVRGVRVEAAAPDAESAARLAAIAQALEAHIATVNQRSAAADAREPQTATEWLVRSYEQQTAGNLPAALDAARHATDLGPDATYAWTRRAELEFSFGRIPEARAALDRGLTLGPQNAQGIALDGFLLAAANDHRAAIARFDDALRLDGGLGNAWLGRGLARIALGERSAGLEDLRTAAAQEPNRSLLRSYFGKALADAGLDEMAGDELRLARTLDTDDPTPWLYSALRERRNRSLNTAARDVLESIARNDNRAIFRSRFLLDQDAAVRGTNLAGIFEDAGLDALAVSEAGRAVETDPVSASAHRFLAGAYDGQRDPYRISKRFETAWFDSLLLANILAPVGSGGLSPIVSQGEYSRLFARGGTHTQLESTLTQHGQVRLLGSIGGTAGRTAWSVDVDHFDDDGPLENDEIRRTEVYASAKSTLGDSDAIYVLAKFKDARNGDVYPRVLAARRDPDFVNREKQDPLWFAAWHHTWSPDQHTIVLLSDLDVRQTIDDLRFRPEVQLTNAAGVVTLLANPPAARRQTNEVSLRSIEIEHLMRAGPVWWIGGIRHHDGDYRGAIDLDFEDPDTDDVFAGLRHDEGEAAVRRTSAYLHGKGDVNRSVSLTAGLTFDKVSFPKNLNYYPFDASNRQRSAWGPSAGLIWTQRDGGRLRAAYSRLLGGFDIDEPIRLEPTSVVGFTKSYRAVIPEAIVGSRPGALTDAWNLAYDRRLAPGAFFNLSLAHLRSDASYHIRAFVFPEADLADETDFLEPTDYTRTFDYRETNAEARVDGMIQSRWTLGAAIAWQRARLDQRFPDWETAWRPAALQPPRVQAGDLWRLSLRGGWQHPSGPYARVEAVFWSQNRTVPDRAARHEIFADIALGWRLHADRGDIALVLLNATNATSGFDPINTFTVPAPERTLALRSSLRF